MKKSVIGKVLFHLWIPYVAGIQIVSIHFTLFDKGFVKPGLLFGGLAVLGTILACLPKVYMDWRDTPSPASRMNRWLKLWIYAFVGAVLGMGFYYFIGSWLQAQFGMAAFQSGAGPWIASSLMFITAMIMYLAVILSGITGIFNGRQASEPMP